MLGSPTAQPSCVEGPQASPFLVSLQGTGVSGSKWALLAHSGDHSVGHLACWAQPRPDSWQTPMLSAAVLWVPTWPGLTCVYQQEAQAEVWGLEHRLSNLGQPRH